MRLYLSLEQLRFGKDLVYEISIDPALDTAAIRIPNMMIQPYIENAIWHGIMPKKASGKIGIRFVRAQEQMLRMVIEDDCKGFPGDGQQTDRKAFGQQLTRERLALLSTLLHQEYHISCGPVFPDSANPGARIEQILPIHPRHDLLTDLEQELNQG